MGLPSSRTCVGINIRRAWRTIARGAAKPWEPSGTAVCETSVAYLRKQSKLAHYFSTGGENFAGKRPPFWGPETDPKTGAKSSGHKQIKLRLNEWPPFWGPFLGSQNGCRFVGKILVTGRKIARVSIVSARTRQKFSMPLLFHGFAAPQALVLHTLRTFMATHVLELFKNMCGHKHSQGVENNCSRRCKTMGTQWHSGMRNFCRVPAETIETCPLFFDRRQKFCRQTAPVLGSRNGPQNGGQVVRTQANQIETE